MKINSYEERQMYLNSNVKGNLGSFALVTYNNETNPMWFNKSEYIDEFDGEYSFSARLLKINKIDYDLIGEHVIDELNHIIKGNFKIDKNIILLPEKLDDLTLITKEYLLEWLLCKEVRLYSKWEIDKVDKILLNIPVGSDIVCKTLHNDEVTIGTLTNKEGNFIAIEYSSTKETISKTLIEKIYVLAKNNSINITTPMIRWTANAVTYEMPTIISNNKIYTLGK